MDSFNLIKGHDGGGILKCFNKEVISTIFLESFKSRELLRTIKKQYFKEIILIKIIYMYCEDKIAKCGHKIRI